jgi:hypothetical protein
VCYSGRVSDDLDARYRAVQSDLSRAAAPQGGNAVAEDRALAAAQAAAAREVHASYLVSEQGDVLRLDDLHAMHYLRRRGREFDYCARIDVDGVLPRCVFSGVGDAVDDDKDLPVHAPSVDGLVGKAELRTRAPALIRAFSLPAVADVLPRWRFRVALRPEDERRTVVEVDVDVGDGQTLQNPVRFACLMGRIARALAESKVVFAEAAVDTRPPAERILDVLDRVTQSVSWLSGPTARVGDGVEARLALDEQPDLPSVLRIDLDAGGRHSVFFEGRFTHAFATDTRLTRQRALLDRLRGLADAKSGDAAFDDAWLCAGEPATLRLLAAQGAVFRLFHAVGATVELGPAGLTVRTPLFADGVDVDGNANADVDVIRVASAALTLWRSLVRHQHGRDLGHAVSQLAPSQHE